MRKHTRMLIGIVIIVAVLLCAGYADPFHVYTLRDDNGGQMLWDANQAYLFMKVTRRGYRMSYGEFAWGALMQWFNAPPSPNDQRVFLVVIRVTPDGVERHLALAQGDTAGVPHSFTPMGQSVFTFCNGVLCKWAGDHFENATPAEQKELGGIERLTPDINTTINGWTKHDVSTDLSVEIGKELTLRVKKGKTCSTRRLWSLIAPANPRKRYGK